MRLAWPWFDPAPYSTNWHIDAICDHLEAVAHGDIKRLLINVPPRTGKTGITSICFPAWTWAQSQISALSGPQVGFLYASYAQDLSVEHSIKTRSLVQSPWYQDLWGGRFGFVGDQNLKTKFANDRGGFRMAASVDGRATGFGADIIIADDPHLVKEAESDVVREGVIRWWTETMPSRLNDQRTGAMIIVMQRVHEDDLSGYVLSHDMGYEHLMIPMLYEPARSFSTSIGWTDPRTKEGELLWPERFPADVTERLLFGSGMTAYARSGQYQQLPVPKGGAIIRATDWKLWEEQTYPPFDYVVASLDSAYTEKQENDYSALTIWGMWNETAGRRIAGSPVPEIVQQSAGATRIMLMYAWNKRLELHGRYVEPLPGESDADWKARQKQEWGLVEWVADSCQRYKVDRLLIEAKASGHSVAQEIRRLIPNRAFGVELVNPGAQDKVARAWAVQHLFAEGMIYAPDKAWADMVINQCASFPKGKNDDLVDSSTQALRHLRDTGMARVSAERIEDTYEAMQLRSPTKPLYAV